MSQSAVQQFLIEQEYKKKNGITPDDVNKLRQWLSTQPHLPAEHISDLDLILTYHCCERSSEVSKQVLDLNLTLRSLFESIFKDRLVDAKTLKTARVLLALPLEVRAHDGSAVLFTHLVDCDPKNLVLPEACRLVLMVLDLWQYEEGTWPGLQIIVDMEGVTLAHLPRLDLHTIQQMMYYLQEALLVKLKGLHFINAPSFMDKVMMLIRPFLKKALMDVISIHQIGSRTLDKSLPMEGLPKDAGGEFKSCEQARDDVEEKLKANQEYFVKENMKRVVESRRPGKPKTLGDIFGGVEGTFKKLVID